MHNDRRIAVLFVLLLVAMAAFALFQKGEEVPAPPATTATIYLYDPRLDVDEQGNILCSEKGLVSTVRTTAGAETPLAEALGELLAGGLTPEEEARGLTTEFPLSGVTIERVSLENGTAIIYIDDPDYKTSGGACRVSIMRAQLIATATEFDDVKEVRFEPIGVFEP